MAVVGYVRVSTTKQDTDNQKNEIEKFCIVREISIDRWVDEIISTRLRDREIFDIVESMGSGDTLVITELSRIGRTLSEIIFLIDTLIAKKIRVIVIKENFDIRDDDPMSMFSIHIIGAFAQLERGMTSKRTKASVDARRSKRDEEIKETGTSSIVIGRPKGAKGKKRKLDGKEPKIKEYLDKGMKKTEIARMLGVDRTVLYDKLAEMGIS